MENREQKYFYDALKAGEAILSFLEGQNQEDFEQNEMLLAAVERKFEIIGESLNRVKSLDESILEKNISHWHKIIGF